MIDKNFYLENLTAFDQLIEYDREAAEKVIYRVYSTLQRDKIWLAANTELSSEEDEELLLDTEQELNELDRQYAFNFQKYHQLVKSQENELAEASQEDILPQIINHLSNDENMEDETQDIEDHKNSNDSQHYLTENAENNIPFNNIEEYLYEEEDDEEEEDESDEDFYMEDGLEYGDEDIDMITDFILNSAKNRINYNKLLEIVGVYDEDFLDENFILPLIAEKANESTDIEIAHKIIPYFENTPYINNIDELTYLISEKSKELELEILVFKISIELIEQGFSPDEVILKIESFLNQ